MNSICWLTASALFTDLSFRQNKILILLLYLSSCSWGIDTLVNLPDGITRGTVPNQAGDQGDTTPKEVPCQCSDANPRNEQSEEVGVDCYYHRIFGNCNEQFMFDANAELCPEHFCQISW